MADETDEVLAGVVRDYLKAVYAAAGTEPPELSDAEVHAAVHQAMPAAEGPPAAGGGLLAWVKALPGHAVGGIHTVWSDWLRRYRETDEVWPLRLFQATHGVVGEGVRDLGLHVRQMAIDKMTALEARYGRVGALTVFGAAVLLTPVPVPGTTFVPVLVAEGVRAVGTTFWGEGTPPSHPTEPEA
jgi:hypothetical protein